MKLLPEWKLILRHAWSARLSLVSSLFAAADAAIEYWLDGKPPVLAGLAFVVSLGSAVSRVVAQEPLRRSHNERNTDRKRKRHDPRAA